MMDYIKKVVIEDKKWVQDHIEMTNKRIEDLTKHLELAKADLKRNQEKLDEINYFLSDLEDKER